jgi:hypothetical protein
MCRHLHLQRRDLLQGFSDVDGDTLSVSALNSNHGSIVVNEDGSFTLTPEQDYNGVVTLSYQVSDGKGGSISTSTQLVLNPVNDAPTANTALTAQSTDEGQSFNYTLPSDAFVDVDGDNLTYSATLSDGSSLPSWLVFNTRTHSFSGTPSFNDSADLTVKVTVSDGQLQAEQSFSLVVNDVTSVNHAPRGVATAILPNARPINTAAASSTIRVVDILVALITGASLTAANVSRCVALILPPLPSITV